MGQRAIGALAIALGVLMIVFALFADTIGIGAQEGTFGWKQVVLLIVGVLVAAGGAGVVTRGSRGAPPA